jgi:hypothetical protein
MPDTRNPFISYARPREEEAHRIAGLLRDEGFSVWRDDPRFKNMLAAAKQRLGLAAAAAAE